MISRGLRSSFACREWLARAFSVAPTTPLGDPESFPTNTPETKSENLSLARFNAQKARGDQIEFRNVKLPELFSKNIGVLGDLKRQQLTIVSVPQSSNSLAEPGAFKEMMNKIIDLKRPVALPIDPTRYIHNSRRVLKVFDEKLYSAEHPMHKQDPLWMHDTKEVNIDVNVMNHYYRAYLQTLKDTQPQGKKALTLDELEADVSADDKDSELPADLYTQHIKLMASGDPAADQLKARQQLEGCYESLFAGAGSYPLRGDVLRISSALSMGFIGGAFSWQPTQLLYRIMLASHMDVEAMVSEMLEIAEQYVELVRSGTNVPVSFEEFLKLQAFSRFSSHNAMYGVAFLEAFAYENGVLPVMIADSATAAHLETYLTDHYDQTLRYADFKDLGAIYDIEMQGDIVKRHAMLDVLFDHKLWGETFVTNEFTYINTDRSRLAELDLKRLQKHYFMAYKKLSAAKTKLKMEAGGSHFDLNRPKSNTRRGAASVSDAVEGFERLV